MSSWAVSRALPLRADNSIEIDAPVDDVWNFILQTERLPEWNEHIVRAQAAGELSEDMRLKMKTRHPETERLTMNIRPTLDVVRVNRELTWSTKIIARWLLSVTDTIKLRPLEDGRTEVEQSMSFSGLLSPGVPFLASISRIKESSNRQLKALIEQN